MSTAIIATTQETEAAQDRRRRHPSATRRLITTELRLLTRDSLTLTFVLGFPIVSMLIIGGVFGSEPDDAFPVNPSHWYVASYFTVVIGATGLIMLPVHIASYRERGVLRRFAAAGFPRWSFALAELTLGLTAIAIAGPLLLAVAAPVYGLPEMHDPLRVAVGIVSRLGGVHQHRGTPGHPAALVPCGPGGRADAVLSLLPARRRRSSAGSDAGRDARDLGEDAAGPGHRRHPPALARHRQRHRSAGRGRRDRDRGVCARHPPDGPVRGLATPRLVNVIEHAARVAAPAALALFAVLGALMSDRPVLVGLGVAGAVAALAAILAWEKMTGWPLAAALALTTAGVVVLGHGQSANLVWMGLCVTAAWVALSSAMPVALTAAGVLGAILVSQWILQTDEPGWAAWLVGTAFTVVACTFARRLRITVEQLSEAQQHLAERSRAEERNRIAAEVHDVVGHALTVALLHIGSARLALDEGPDEARRALVEAERLTRDSLDEVRASVGLMRTDAPGETAPLPDARAIPELVESFRRAGSIVELDVAGELGTVGPARGLAAYRIVQEALTNATRHAPGEPVSVEISVDQSETTVAVRNDGTVDHVSPAGSGLRGMRERAEGVGGWLSAGTLEETARRGWLVEAVLPS